jgi:ankyrin repeat protein
LEDRKAGYDEHLMRLLLKLAEIVVLAMSQSLAAQPPARTAIDRALPPLQRSAAQFVAKRSCFSCHHNALPILTLQMARERGFAIDPSVLSAIEDTTFTPLRASDALDQSIQAATLNDPTPNDSYLLMAAAAAGLDRNLATAVRAKQLLGWQQDGHWVTSDFRPPHSSSLFTATATAIRAIDLYAPQELRLEKKSAFDAARKWLKKTPAASTEDAAFRLMGLVWSGGSVNDLNGATADLLAMQAQDGGWPQLQGYPSDAYSTGESLFALREAGITANSAAWSRGAAFLVATQAADGTWHVKTRMTSPATVSPPYFTTGFPYGKDEFLSYAGTSWAVMALLRSFPAPAPAKLLDAKDPEPWIKTALFGTADQLLKLLDGGLDANAKTSDGTTLLMMAAPDTAKVRLLIARGGNVKARGTSGHDALTIASAYRGTTASLRVLLDAGADASPPDDVHVRRSPLVFAAMAGDAANVKLLLDRGADPSEYGPLPEAITFGHTDVVRILIHAGADTGLKESSGVNLMHWATITGRAGVIPLLAKAGVPVNDPDKAGFTPLMYAATIDFGETATLRALLGAGADRTMKNPEGRNALEQARYLKNGAIEAELKRR